MDLKELKEEVERVAPRSIGSRVDFVQVVEAPLMKYRPSSTEDFPLRWNAVIRSTARSPEEIQSWITEFGGTVGTNTRGRGRGGLIESCMQTVGAPPQTPGRLRRKNVTWGSAHRLAQGLPISTLSEILNLFNVVTPFTS